MARRQAPLDYTLTCASPTGSALWLADKRRSITLELEKWLGMLALWLADKRRSITLHHLVDDLGIALWLADKRRSITLQRPARR